jgi:hypothetical protein
MKKREADQDFEAFKATYLHPCLEFLISNSPFVTKYGWHAYCEYPEGLGDTWADWYKETTTQETSRLSGNLHGTWENRAWQDMRSWVKTTSKGELDLVAYLPDAPKLYIAKYYGGNDLRIYQATNTTAPGRHGYEIDKYILPGMEEPIERVHDKFYCGDRVDDPMDVFKMMAWLQDIPLGTMTLEVENEYIENPWLESDVWRSEKSVLEEPNLDSFHIAIRNAPDLLRNPELLDIYITMRKTAMGNNDTKAKEMRRRLKESIPDDKIVNSNWLKLASNLMTELAKHLKGRYKNHFGHHAKGFNTKNGTGRSVNAKQHKEFTAWAREVSEARIAALSRAELSALIHRSRNRYIPELLAKGAGVSQKTLSRNR